MMGNTNFRKDLVFAKRTEAAFRRYEKGEFREMDFEDFLRKVKKW